MERICNLSTQVMLDFIAEFPSARLVKTVKPRTIQKALQRKGVETRLTTYTAEELILQGKVRTLQHLLQRQNELTKVLTEYCKSAILEDFKIVTSINGISKCTATTFLAEIGCIGNYASHKKLIAFAGIDPTVYQSGKFEGSSRISKRGNRHLRRVIWLMTVNVVQHNATFRTYFMNKRKEGAAVQKSSFCNSS